MHTVSGDGNIVVQQSPPPPFSEPLNKHQLHCQLSIKTCSEVTSEAHLVKEDAGNVAVQRRLEGEIQVKG